MTEKSKRGRKKITPTPEQIKEAGQMAVFGCLDKDIYQFLKISHDTYYKWMREFPEFSEEINKGRATGVVRVAGKHFQAAMAGDVKAQQFFLARRGGFHETTQIQPLGKDGERASWSVEFINSDLNKGDNSDESEI